MTSFLKNDCMASQWKLYQTTENVSVFDTMRVELSLNKRILHQYGPILPLFEWKRVVFTDPTKQSNKLFSCKYKWCITETIANCDIYLDSLEEFRHYALPSIRQNTSSSVSECFGNVPRKISFVPMTPRESSIYQHLLEMNKIKQATNFCHWQHSNIEWTEQNKVCKTKEEIQNDMDIKYSVKQKELQKKHQHYDSLYMEQLINLKNLPTFLKECFASSVEETLEEYRQLLLEYQENRDKIGDEMKVLNSRYTFASKRIALEDWSDTSCTICLESFDEIEVVLITCGHTYHYFCLAEWLLCKRRSCPQCKVAIEKGTACIPLKEDPWKRQYGSKGAWLLNFLNHAKENTIVIYAKSEKILESLEDILSKNKIEYLTAFNTKQPMKLVLLSGIPDQPSKQVIDILIMLDLYDNEHRIENSILGNGYKTKEDIQRTTIYYLASKPELTEFCDDSILISEII